MSLKVRIIKYLMIMAVAILFIYILPILNKEINLVSDFIPILTMLLIVFLSAFSFMSKDN